ncbi:sulfotransferase [Marivirga harenae]|uniref:sulfotransferase family protein n=1 Tax=Marivirga harenae TaxID=2010992 RepID=UPI0026E0E99C|nr:sulfotransferase [Marivirga harenae]WKV12886.1 sulfotransferase [Marivirga harenae]|tara:strand:- start:14898 stop:15827 length:930 start_codon:yes stop_codon:yes gene_type:complete
MNSFKNLPDFLIIGAGKSGTTSVDNYLKQHPEIFISPVKEPNFFGYELNTPKDFEGSPQLNHYNSSVTNIDDYLKLFQGASVGQVKGETSNTYMYHEHAAKRIKHYVPHVKLIAILRQPAERLYSRYLHLAREDKLPSKEFADCLDKNTIWWKRNDLIKEGFYGKYLDEYYKLFDHSQIKVFLYEELREDPVKLHQEIFHFLGVNEDFEIDFSITYNQSGFIKNPTVDKLIGSKSPLVTGLKKIISEKNLQRLKDNRFIFKKVNDLRSKNLSKPKLAKELKSKISNEIYRQDILLLQALIDKDLSHWLD